MSVRTLHDDEEIGLLRESVVGLPDRDPAGGIDQEVIAYIYRAHKAQ